MVKKYRPSNGSEGMAFTGEYCDRCANQHPDPDNKKQCMILCNTMAFDLNDPEYPSEWVYRDGKPTCTAWKLHLWEKDEETGEWNELEEPPTIDPDQLKLF